MVSGESIAADAELLAAWRRGDQHAGSALFERHYAAIARFFGNKAPEAAEDLMQRTFLACVEGLHRFRNDASVRTLLFAIAHNLLKNYYRSRRRTPATEGDEELEERAVDLSPGPTTLIARREEHRLLLEGLRRIPLAYQIVLELYYWEQLQVAAIAEITGVPEGTIKTRLRRGRELLEEAMASVAASKDLLESTLGNLEGWADDLRRTLAARADSPRGNDQA